MYKASYKLISGVFACSGNFTREYKYTVGQDLKKEGIDLMKNIYRANKVEDKIEHIEKARENVEVIRLLIRLMQDANGIGFRKFVEINKDIEDVSKQLVNWEKYNREKTLPPESSVARAQTSVRSKSNSPLVPDKESCSELDSGHIAQLHQKNCAINSEAIFPLAGNRNNSSAALNNQGSNGNYWSSSPNGTNSYNLNLTASGVNPANNNNRANGFSVRCVKDLQTTV